MGREFALHMADLGLITVTLYDPLSTALGVIPEHKAKRKLWA